MGNLVGLMAHVPRGGEIIGPAEIHACGSEAAGHAVVAGASVRSIPAHGDGTIDLDPIREAARDRDDIHEPITSLIVRGLRERGIAMIEYPKGLIRAVTHHGIERDGIERAISSARETLADLRLAFPVAV